MGSNTRTRDVLQNRARTHGNFADHAKCTQSLKSAAAAFPNWNKLSPAQRESLEMIFHKVGRIMAGDPDFHDHWLDIAGYAQLVADELEENPHD